MTDFETRLRHDLDRAADLAPTFRGVASDRAADTDARPHRSRTPGWRGLALAAAAVAAVAATTPLWWPGADAPPEEASCAAVMEVGTVRYVAHGELLRVPRPGRDLGAATVLGCDDVADRTVRAAALPGVDSTEAVLADGSAWVVDDGSVPEELQILSQPVRCSGAGTQTLGGDWISVRGAQPDQDGALGPPYVALVQADTGESLPLETWSSVRVEVEVTSQTAGGADPALVARTLQGGAPVQAEVTCVGGRYVASSLAPRG